MSKPSPHELITQVFKEKSSLKQEICSKTSEVFTWMNTFLQSRESVYKSEMESVDERVKFEYTAPGPFEGRLKFGGDVLVFHQHSNIFKISEDHSIWKTGYVQEDPSRAYTGIINIYNFLADSFRYNRQQDSGYLIARMFINKDMHFFVEGKRQLGFLYNDFITEKVTEQHVQDVIESAILYALEFDLYVPPYDNMKLVTVQQIQHLTKSSMLQTGKRLGFRFSADGSTID